MRKPRDLKLPNYAYHSGYCYLDDDGKPKIEVDAPDMPLAAAGKLAAWLTKVILWAEVEEAKARRSNKKRDR
jgi:hypothetical protein